MSARQLSLLPGDTGSSARAGAPLPARARRTDPLTSHAAARSMKPDALSKQRTAVLNVVRALYGTPYDGATAWDCARSIGAQQSVMARRLLDLEELGYVRRTTRTRPGSSGRALIVWVPVR